MVFCPSCYSPSVKKYGSDRSGSQKYICDSCGKQFTQKTGTPFCGMRHPEKIIVYALNLHYRHRVPLRNVRERLRERGINVSHVAIFEWKQKVGSYFLQLYMRHREYARRWYVDIRQERINGKNQYLFFVYDSNGIVLAVRVSPRKNLNLVDDVLKDASILTGFQPDAIMGDTNLLEKIRR
jgi:transposase-like protein